MSVDTEGFLTVRSPAILPASLVSCMLGSGAGGNWLHLQVVLMPCAGFLAKVDNGGESQPVAWALGGSVNHPTDVLRIPATSLYRALC